MALEKINPNLTRTGVVETVKNSINDITKQTNEQKQTLTQKIKEEYKGAQLDTKA